VATNAPIWPNCRPEQVPGEVQNAINAVMAGEGVPARARLRYRDPQNGKWRVFDTIEIDGDDDVGEGFNERLAAFAVSAAIHLATLQGWLDRDGHRCSWGEGFDFQVQPTDGAPSRQKLTVKLKARSRCAVPQASSRERARRSSCRHHGRGPHVRIGCEQVLGDHEAKLRALIDAAARERAPPVEV
jgi:hypothetical protein